MKKLYFDVLALLTISLSGLLFASPQPVSATPFVRKTTAKVVKQNGRVSPYFKFTRNYRTKLILETTQGKPFKRLITIPKGTVISGNLNTNRGKITSVMPGYVPLSYHLTQKVAKKYQVGEFNYNVNYFSGALKRIKRPAYVLPYGQNQLVFGKPINLWPSRAVHAPAQVTITSDGFVEYRPYQSFKLGKAALSYRSRPASAAKITHVLKRGANMYLYFRTNLKGVNDKRIHKSGSYQYRLTVRNQHTPYIYGDRNNDFATLASFYSLGSQSYWTNDGTIGD